MDTTGGRRRCLGLDIREWALAAGLGALVLALSAFLIQTLRGAEEGRDMGPRLTAYAADVHHLRSLDWQIAAQGGATIWQASEARQLAERLHLAALYFEKRDGHDRELMTMTARVDDYVHEVHQRAAAAGAAPVEIESAALPDTFGVAELLDSVVERHSAETSHLEKVIVAATVLLLLLMSAVVAGLAIFLQRRRTAVQRTFAGHRVLAASEERFRNVVQNSRDLIAIIDRGGRLIYISPSAERILRAAPSAIEGRRLAEVVDPAHASLFEAALDAALRQPGESVEFEGRFVATDGAAIEVDATLRNLLHVPSVAGIVVNARDITERRQFSEQLARLANFDTLTDLPNRRRFERDAEERLGRIAAAGACATLVLIDLDSFRTVTERFGHRLSGQVLQSVGNLVASRAHETDLVCRFDGDQFAVLATRTDPAEARFFAEGLRNAIESAAFEAVGSEVSVTASIGYAIFPRHGTSFEALLSSAEAALDWAREAGNRAVQYRPAGDRSADDGQRRSWERRIREAIDGGNLELFAQPVVTIAGEVSHYEALLRLRASDGSIVMPGEFIGIAERSSLILDVDRWVVSAATEYLARAAAMGGHLRLSVNLSGRSLVDPQTLSHLRHEVRRRRFRPADLTVEITETAAIADLQSASRAVRAIKHLGLQVAIDDFGAGFASFSYLKHLPVDFVKIDGSFIRNLSNDEDDRHLVRAMVEAAHGLGKRTVAEFVEDAATHEWLQRLGLDFAQGYHFGRPAPLSALFSASGDSDDAAA